MESTFYKKAADYWSKIPPTLEGVLGGFGFISDIDINGSKIFLNELLSLQNSPSKNVALDCGAGIGRITKDLLIHIFDKVDMIEQNAAFLKEAENTIEPKSKLGSLYPTGLQNFIADKKYDVIWCQWVLGHLTDPDFIKFFHMCMNSLSENGVIIVKENVTSSGNLEKDDIDSSVTRSLKHLLLLFKKSQLKVIKEHKQTNFPAGIYPVYIFALRSAIESDTRDDKKEEKMCKDVHIDNNVDIEAECVIEKLKHIHIDIKRCDSEQEHKTSFCGNVTSELEKSAVDS